MKTLEQLETHLKDLVSDPKNKILIGDYNEVLSLIDGEHSIEVIDKRIISRKNTTLNYILRAAMEELSLWIHEEDSMTNLDKNVLNKFEFKTIATINDKEVYRLPDIADLQVYQRVTFSKVVHYFVKDHKVIDALVTYT